MKKNIKVVEGNGKDLKISPIFNHLNAVKPKKDSKKNGIVIPEIKAKRK